MTRQEAIEILKDKAFIFCDIALCEQDCTDCSNALNTAIEALEERSKHGKWKNVSGSWDIQEMCNQCGKIVYEPNYNYCPNCGIKMESDWVSVFEKNQKEKVSQNESEENIV